ALILTPTRELAAQIGDCFTTYARHLELWHTVIFGGVSDKAQIRELREGIDALIATPGRLLDLAHRGEIDLGKVELFVLDEADRMLDMGFLPDVKRVVTRLPQDRQTLFFSATMPPEIRALADRLLRSNAVAVNAAQVSAPAEGVEQQLYFVDKANKRHLLVDLLRSDETKKTLVFSRTKHGANRIVKVLDKAGIHSAAIHGNKSQGARTRALEAFRNADIDALVATDIAARGIDVEGVSHVINFDLPNVPETYVHRIGRTARAGATGKAISMCDVEERPYLVSIERLMGKHLHRVDDHAYPPTEAVPAMTDLSPSRAGHVKNGRPLSGKKTGSKRRGRPGGHRPRRPRRPRTGNASRS
ncbi:MAG: DEAD/DEAH box helicase, partial [Myxococcota bacterium]